MFVWLEQKLQKQASTLSQTFYFNTAQGCTFFFYISGSLSLGLCHVYDSKNMWTNKTHVFLFNKLVQARCHSVYRSAIDLLNPMHVFTFSIWDHISLVPLVLYSAGHFEFGFCHLPCWVCPGPTTSAASSADLVSILCVLCPWHLQSPQTLAGKLHMGAEGRQRDPPCLSDTGSFSHHVVVSKCRKPQHVLCFSPLPASV